MILQRDNRKDIASICTDETIFVTQNNYMGVRGNFEEDVPYHSSIRGAYINGFYDSHPIEYGEKAFGFPEIGQTIVNIPDGQSIVFYVNNEPLSLTHCKLIDLKRRYHLNQGYTERIVVYETKEGFQFRLTFKRMTHLQYKPLFMISATIESLNFNGDIKIISSLNGKVKNYVSKDDPRAGSKHAEKLNVLDSMIESNHGYIELETMNTQFKLLAGMTHSQSFSYEDYQGLIHASRQIALKPNESFSFDKYVLYYNSLDHPEMHAMYQSGLNLIHKHDVNQLYRMQEEALQSFSEMAEIEIESKHDPVISDTIFYNLYQLYTAGGHSPRTNIPAKGLSGEGYEGHTFWDTEIYLLPFFMQIDQKLAVNLLEYRYFQLENAKKEAEKLGVYEGVKFAWRTINGDETSAYYAAGTAQYHINCDIAYAYIKYVQLYDDLRFMKNRGFKVLLETARFFKHVVHKHEGKYHLHHVTGPDEYTAVIDNNYYTNSMLKFHLEYLIDYIEKYEMNSISDEEMSIFKDIATNIVLPFDKVLNIDVQDASFLSKKPWDFENADPAKYPLLLHYHPLTIYRHQVLKQADTVLSHVLLNNRPIDIMNDSFNYYEERTTHDSSLSTCVHALQAAKLGKLEKAYDYFYQTLALDLDNAHKNTHHGLHVANLGGMYLALLNGFLNYRIDKKGVSIAPRIPSAWESLKMKIRVNSECVVSVFVTQNSLIVKPNIDCELSIYEKIVQLFAHESYSICF